MPELNLENDPMQFTVSVGDQSLTFNMLELSAQLEADGVTPETETSESLAKAMRGIAEPKDLAQSLNDVKLSAIARRAALYINDAGKG